MSDYRNRAKFSIANSCRHIQMGRARREVIRRAPHLYAALDEPEVFAIGHRKEAPECLVEQSVNAALDETFAEAEALLLRRMRDITLADLADDFARRHAARRQQDND